MCHENNEFNYIFNASNYFIHQIQFIFRLLFFLLYCLLLFIFFRIFFFCLTRNLLFKMCFCYPNEEILCKRARKFPVGTTCVCTNAAVHNVVFFATIIRFDVAAMFEIQVNHSYNNHYTARITLYTKFYPYSPT